MLAAMGAAKPAALAVTTLGGRRLTFEPGIRDRAWLVASHVQALLQQAGLTLGTLPSLILLPKFAAPGVDALTAGLAEALRAACTAGLKDPD